MFVHLPSVLPSARKISASPLLHPVSRTASSSLPSKRVQRAFNLSLTPGKEGPKFRNRTPQFTPRHCPIGSGIFLSALLNRLLLRPTFQQQGRGAMCNDVKSSFAVSHNAASLGSSFGYVRGFHFRPRSPIGIQINFPH